MQHKNILINKIGEIMFTFIKNLFSIHDDHPLIRLAENEYRQEFNRIQKMLGRRPVLHEVEHLFNT